MNFHTKTAAQTVKELQTNIRNGLSSSEAKHRLQKYGANKLYEKKKKGLISKFIAQFSDFMVLILLITAAISFFTAIMDENGDFVDPVMILVIVILNAIIGVIQENKAEKAIDALKKLSAPHTTVIRDGQEQKILSENLVVGDIIRVETGDMLCADARLIEAFSLKAEEASLTGETLAADKDANFICSAETPLGDMHNMLFSSAFITLGHGTAVVTATGMNTQVGKIANMISEEETPKTPLQKSLAKTGKILGLAAIIICILIFLLGLMQKIPALEMFMIAISLAVAAIPEGLPAIVTIVLALGVRKMALHRAIVRHLPAVETLGSANVICSDKTGTLTQNRMTVTNITTANGSVPQNTPEGAFVLSLGALCSNSTLTTENGNYQVHGEPTENAIVLAAAKAGQIKNHLDCDFPKTREFPFDSARKRMTTVHRLKTGGYRIISKGAADILLPLCSSEKTHTGFENLNTQRRQTLNTVCEQMASRAMRIIAVAYKDCDTVPKTVEDAESKLTFIGFIGMIDPPREEAKSAVARCRKAGIRTVMITGDHAATARAIAAELGILSGKDKIMTGAELDRTPQETLEKQIFNYTVFARVSPEHKVRIVKAFRSRDCIVAMTGDGVNDAPALKAADIGCAMGITGTDVAKSAADMILTDDNFATIVDAVEQGRGIFENIKKCIHFLLSSNIGEILTVLIAFLLRLPSPLLAIQLLWVNLVTDSLPALALGTEPTAEDIMERPPNNSKKGMFSGGLWSNIIIEGCFIGALAFLAFTIGRVFFDGNTVPIVGRTMTFAVLSLSQLVHSFNIRSEKSIFSTKLFGNMKLIGAFFIGASMQIAVISLPFCSSVFKTTPLSSVQWLIVLILSLMPLLISETEKAFAHRKTEETAKVRT
ncbi:MAG: calcium-translocating P-type ATPase, PMCA-type [Acutalibacteraceae bacterium]